MRMSEACLSPRWNNWFDSDLNVTYSFHANLAAILLEHTRDTWVTSMSQKNMVLFVGDWLVSSHWCIVSGGRISDYCRSAMLENKVKFSAKERAT